MSYAIPLELLCKEACRGQPAWSKDHAVTRVQGYARPVQFFLLCSLRSAPEEAQSNSGLYWATPIPSTLCLLCPLGCSIPLCPAVPLRFPFGAKHAPLLWLPFLLSQAKGKDKGKKSGAYKATHCACSCCAHRATGPQGHRATGQHQ